MTSRRYYFWVALSLLSAALGYTFTLLLRIGK